VFEQVGLFDTSYFLYFEDADFCRRARQAGFHLWCVPRARMWHRVAQSSRNHRPVSRYTNAWGRARFYCSHPGRRCPGLVYAYLLAKLLLTTCGDMVRGERHLIWPLWQGTWDGYRNNPPVKTVARLRTRP
jgi:hypothetical protein